MRPAGARQGCRQECPWTDLSALCLGACNPWWHTLQRRLLLPTPLNSYLHPSGCATVGCTRPEKELASLSRGVSLHAEEGLSASLCGALAAFDKTSVPRYTLQRDGKAR